MSQIQTNTCPLCRRAITDEPRHPTIPPRELFIESEDEDLDELLESLQQSIREADQVIADSNARIEHITASINAMFNSQMFERVRV